MTRTNKARNRGGKSEGYGWPATLQLLSPPLGKPVDSRLYVTETKKVGRQGADCMGEIGKMFEKFVTYGSPVLMSATISVRWGLGEYNG